MKKLITFSAICIVASILLSSCGLNMSITKRHYNNGYYVSYSDGKQAVFTPKEKEGQSKTSEALNSVQDQAEQNTKSEYSEQSPTTDNTVVVADNEKTQRKAISHQRTKEALKQITKTIKNPVAEIKHGSLLAMPKIITNAPEREGLSLFWIVILVVLILWALGFLAGGFGLGGLINLLLIVALILFILWLLRVL